MKITSFLHHNILYSIQLIQSKILYPSLKWGDKDCKQKKPTNNSLSHRKTTQKQIICRCKGKSEKTQGLMTVVSLWGNNIHHTKDTLFKKTAKEQVHLSIYT